MASLVTYKKKLKRVDFTLTPNGKRRSVRLGRIPNKKAISIKTRIEKLIENKILQQPHDTELCQWLSEIDEKLRRRLRAVGLAEGLGMTQTSLGDFLGRAEQARQVKESTATFYAHTHRNLKDYFGAGRLVSDITEADADTWRAWLIDDQKLAKSTVARRVIAARTIWCSAVRWNMASRNPFEGIKGGSQQNPERLQFVSHAQIEKVLEACPDVQWRALISLCRYGGLRNPSETLALRWQDIHWEGPEPWMLIHSSKTEHYEGKGERKVPLFKELRSVLMEAFEAAEDGDEYVITRYRDNKQNLGTQFKRIIQRAGVVPWPKLFQNLRASRETELMRDYDLTTVCKWIGNSPAVAAKHYAMSTDLNADFSRAAGFESQTEAQQKAQQTPTETDGQAKSDLQREEPKPPKDNTLGNDCRELATAVEGVEWAIQDLNL